MLSPALKAGSEPGAGGTHMAPPEAQAPWPGGYHLGLLPLWFPPEARAVTGGKSGPKAGPFLHQRSTHRPQPAAGIAE